MCIFGLPDIIEQNCILFQPSKGKPWSGTTFWQLYQICRREFLVSSEASLSHVMVEFQDHNVVSTKKTSDGSDSFVLAVERDILMEFLRNQGHEDVFPSEDD